MNREEFLKELYKHEGFGDINVRTEEGGIFRIEEDFDNTGEIVYRIGFLTKNHCSLWSIGNIVYKYIVKSLKETILDVY